MEKENTLTTEVENKRIYKNLYPEKKKRWCKNKK